ncbi:MULTISPECIES: META domain-containing protein [unclassified Endozoicomonas]|uniref:META domain-containing protein n=1 Tax=unclassified Endozoicomonas TaxID=2644528 RepID=UPI0021498E96|nr:MULTISPECIES: META domain-containing protein [unclassified Endozoicomonas]
MRTMGRYVLVLAAGGFLAACTTPDKSVVVTPTDVEGKTWVLHSLNGAPPVNGKRVTLEFQSASSKDGQISGRGPCNGYFGSYTMQQDELQFGRVGSTMMACPEPYMKQEMAYFKGLQQVDTMTSNGLVMTLKGRHNDETITYFAESAKVRGVIKSSTGSFPAGSDVIVSMKDITNKDHHSNLIGEKKIRLDQGVDGPLKFDVPYSPSLIEPNHTYSVAVEVRQNGKLISHSTSNKIIDFSRPLEFNSGQ